MKKVFALFAAAALLSSCEKEECPWVSKDVIDQLTDKIEHVAIIYNNDIYYFEDLQGTPRQVTNTPSVDKKYVKMNHAHTRFAYLNGSNQIEIVDIAGNLVTQLTQYASVRSFDWSANDSTLYILDGNTVQFHGPAMNIPSITYPNVPSNVQKWVRELAVSKYNDIAYVLETYDWLSGYQKKIIIRKANTNPGSEIIISPTNTDPSYLDFSVNEAELTVGYADYPATDGSLEKVEVYDNYHTYPTFDLESSEVYATPNYRKDKEAMVKGYLFNSTEFTVMARMLSGSQENITRSDYSHSGVMFVDWK